MRKDPEQNIATTAPTLDGPRLRVILETSVKAGVDTTDERRMAPAEYSARCFRPKLWTNSASLQMKVSTMRLTCTKRATPKYTCRCISASRSLEGDSTQNVYRVPGNTVPGF